MTSSKKTPTKSQQRSQQATSPSFSGKKELPTRDSRVLNRQATPTFQEESDIRPDIQPTLAAAQHSLAFNVQTLWSEFSILKECLRAILTPEKPNESVFTDALPPAMSVAHATLTTIEREVVKLRHEMIALRLRIDPLAVPIWQEELSRVIAAVAADSQKAELELASQAARSEISFDLNPEELEKLLSRPQYPR